MSPFLEKVGRRAGLSIPLSAVRCRRDRGAGDFGSLAPLLDWMREAGLSALSLLPLDALGPKDSCPYWPADALAFDPLYADIDALPGPPAPPPRSERVDFKEVRALKRSVLGPRAQDVLAAQWASARRLAEERGILLMGDLPFGLSPESVQARERPADFVPGLRIGAPPDRYSAAGQDWGMPAYDWERMEAGGHALWRARLGRCAGLYDLARLDHVVGFFRTWVLGPGGGRFDIEGKAAQRARGERFLRLALEAAAPCALAAEDLGVIPPFVREVLRDLGMPGYRIARWEREPGGAFLHPKDYPALSIAASGTHDTAALAGWWEELGGGERADYWSMASGTGEAPPSLGDDARELLLENLYAAGSCLTLLPWQDVVGSRERVNVPGTLNESNWTCRMPLPIEDFAASPEGRRCSSLLRDLARRSARLPGNLL